MKASLFALVCSLTLGFLPMTVRAQSQENGMIVVVVTDAATHKPLDSAQVFLLGGDQPQSSLTNTAGLLIFGNVQPGTYRVQVKAGGYADSDAVEADVGEAQRLNVAVALQPMKIIASVVARGAVSITSEDINANSPQGIVSQSLLDALGKIAGVNVEDDLYGGDSAFNISLHGADAAQTAYSIDGVQVRGPAAQAVSGFQDLFGSSSINFSPSASSPAGMVSFFTAQPTKVWSYHFTGAVGNYSDTLGAWTASGGAGKAAFVVEHAAGGQDYPLDGSYFADSTGTAYLHRGALSRRSDLFKTAVSLSAATSLKYTLLSGHTSQSTLCSSAVTLLPCGFGADAGTHGTNLMQMVNLSSIIGHVDYNLIFDRGKFEGTTAQPNRAVNGTLSPFNATNSSLWSAEGMYASSSARRHTISWGFYDSLSSGRYVSTYNATGTASNARSERFGSIWVGDKIKANDKLAIDYTLSQASGTGAGSNLQFYGEATWQPEKSDAFTFGGGLGSADPAPAFSGVVGDALTAQYDCYNKSVFVNGPSDEATKQSSLQYDAAWQHRWKYGQLTIDAYRNRFDGQGIFGSVPFAGEPSSIFPNGQAAYLASLEQVWEKPTVCGSIPFDPSRVYVSQYISGINQINQGFTIGGRIAMGRNVMAFPNYAVSSAALSSLDPRLEYAGSYFTVGTQMPHQPLHTAGLTLIGAVPHRPLEWALNAQFTAANNWQNLPAHTIYNAGVVMNLQRGSLRFFESNIFGTDTGLFTTYQGVNPLPVQGGGSFSLATTPLAPRSFSVQYDVRWR
jgi:hypothetical protein